jgi:pimeloyl-ACP methyl ester carboxylesterase
LSAPILHHDRVTAAPGAEPARWLYVLHGIFGAGRNWASIARRVVRRRPEWGALLVDLREHGRSGAFPPPHTIAAAAQDVDVLVRATGLPPTAMLGHSFGGKVALMFAREYGVGVGLEQLWIIDSLPDPVPTPQGGAWGMLGMLRRHPGPFAGRGEAVAALEAEGLPNGVAQWASTNLEPSAGGQLRWRLDPDAIEVLLRDFFRTDLRDVVADPPAGMRIHFVRAASSDVLPVEVAERIRALGHGNGRVTVQNVRGGHWLNADNPDAMEALLVEGL